MEGEGTVNEKCKLAGADPEFVLGGGAPISNGVTDW